MTELVDPNDYPLLLSALPFLCDRAIWLERQAALQSWIAEANNFAVEQRVEIFRDISRTSGTYMRLRDRHIFHDDETTINTEIGLSLHQRKALEGLKRAQKMARDAAFNRIFRGEIKVIARARQVPAPWFVVEPEWIKSGDFILREHRNWTHSVGKNKKNLDFVVRLRDRIGVAIDQAVFAYGEPDQAEQLDKLYGTQSSSDPAIRQAYDGIAAGILGRLRGGMLVGVEAGSTLPAGAWTGDEIMRRPDLLIRNKVPGCSGDLVELRATESLEPQKEKVGRKMVDDTAAVELIRKYLLDEGLNLADAVSRVIREIPGKPTSTDDQNRLQRYKKKAKAMPWYDARPNKT